MYFCPQLAAFKRAIAPINPLAVPQVSTTESVGVAAKFGEKWWAPDVFRRLFSLTHQESQSITCSPVTTIH